MQSPAQTYVSIDWDFFCARPQAPRTPGYLDAPYGSEEQGDWLRDLAWNERVEQARAAGVDLAQHFGMVAGPSPREMTTTLATHLDLAGSPLQVADSHRHAYEAVAAYGRPLDVVSFDAHHDLGYSAERTDAEEEYTRFGCDSWLLWALRHGHASRVTVVLPDWLDTSRDDNTPEQFLGAQARQVTIVRYSEWAESAHARHWPHVAGMFLARSGWWSPPWCDRDLQDLHEHLTQAGVQTTSVIESALDARPHMPLTGEFSGTSWDIARAVPRHLRGLREHLSPT